MNAKREAKSRKPRRIANDARKKNVIDLLDDARNAAYARVRVLREDEEADAVAIPGDGLDVAHSLEEIEMDAGLIERCEERLRAIDDAFNRLKRGRYGICEKCKREIPIKRLKAIPFAAHCIDCQEKRNERRRPGEGDIDEPSRNVWTPPEEMNEAANE